MYAQKWLLYTSYYGRLQSQKAEGYILATFNRLQERRRFTFQLFIMRVGYFILWFFFIVYRMISERCHKSFVMVLYD